MGNVSTIGRTFVRATKSSIRAMSGGLPAWLPETERSASSGTGGIFRSDCGMPTSTSRPCGRRALTWSAQAMSDEAVERMKSNDRSAFFNSSVPRVATNRVAPRARAWSSLSCDVEIAVTSQPNAARNCTARCPSPPMPTTAVFIQGATPKWSIGVNTVVPAHSKGPARPDSIASGIGIAKLASQRTRSAQPPWRPTIVGRSSAQNDSRPRAHHSQCPHEPACQPTPTRWPTRAASTPDPTATIPPTTSWPGTSG